MKRDYDYRTISLFVVSILLFILVLIFIVRPSITGYGIYQDVKSKNISLEDLSSDINSLKEELIIKSTNLSICKDSNDRNEEKLSFCLERLDKVEDEYLKLEISTESLVGNLNKDVTICQERVELSKEDSNNCKRDMKDQVGDLEDSYNRLASNSARIICCKKKVDNPQIDYYEVESDQIECKEDSGIELLC